MNSIKNEKKREIGINKVHERSFNQHDEIVGLIKSNNYEIELTQFDKGYIKHNMNVKREGYKK